MTSLVRFLGLKRPLANDSLEAIRAARRAELQRLLAEIAAPRCSCRA